MQSLPSHVHSSGQSITHPRLWGPKSETQGSGAVGEEPACALRAGPASLTLPPLGRPELRVLTCPQLDSPGLPRSRGH